MPFFPFPEWKPDVADYLAPHSNTITNVYPQADGYGPVQEGNAITHGTLAAACRGAFMARKEDNTYQLFAGTSTKLYRQTGATWVDVSKGAGSYTAIDGGYNWGFAQFGDFIIAVHGDTVPQVFDLGSSSAFADLGGSPPTARYVSTVAGFVVLSGLVAEPFRIHWSGQGSAITWTSGTDQSDFQDFADGGGLVGPIAGGADYATIFSESAIRRMTYMPGSPVIFQIDKIVGDRGILRPYSMVPLGERVFYISQHGFEMIGPGGKPAQIGREKVDRYYLSTAASGVAANLRTIGAADPNSSRIIWGYPVGAVDTAGNGKFSQSIVYDYVLDRFSYIDWSGSGPTPAGQWIGTLCDVDASIPRPELTLIDNSNDVHPLTGNNLAATLVTADFGNSDGKRIFIRGIRPITDCTFTGSLMTVAVSARDEYRDTETYSSEAQINDQGYAPVRVSTRYARCRLTIATSAADWTFAGGIEPDYVTEGLR